MDGQESQPPRRTSSEVKVIPPSPYTEPRKPSVQKERLAIENDQTEQNKAPEKTGISALYDARRKTLLGRSAFNWARLAGFYTVFYFCLGCFFVILLYAFAWSLDREKPTYYNKDSTMAVRTTATVVGMGFRPQPEVDDSLIRVTDDPRQQQRIASSLRLFRDVYLLQRPEAKTEECSEEEPASELVPGAACTFNWFHIVQNQDHPCSDNNMYGFKKQEPCVIVKINKVYGWVPIKGQYPSAINQLRNAQSNKSVAKPDVYVTCDGSHPADKEALGQIIYYSLENPNGSPKYGTIPNYYFPYRNAPDHVQPFVLVQFKNLPLHRLISITCRVWAPNIVPDTRGMRGMVSFQLYRSQATEKVHVEP